MNFTEDKITEIFYLADEFCKEFDAYLSAKIIGNKHKRKPTMTVSEVVTITVLFHSGYFRNMKHFYLNYVQKHLSKEFPNTVSYNRFTELMQSSILEMSMFLKTCCLGDCTGISYVDSTLLSVCKNKRTKRNNTKVNLHCKEH
jgi:hypothetical protein